MFFGSSARADGGIFPHDRYAAETSQRALIYYNNGTENLIVTATFQGNSSDFAWVIPAPTKPAIFKSYSSLFNTLGDITGNNQNEQTFHGKTSLGLSGAPKSQPVEVISEKTIDMYDTAVLKATDEQALAKWLVDHGYSFPTDKAYSLKDYIDRGWYFAIAKIKPSAVASAEVQSRLSEGTITPLRLVFKTNEIVYPMKLTRIALDYAKKKPTFILDQPVSTSSSYLSNTMYIDLYVLTDGKTVQPSLDTQWANWIGQKEISKLNSAAGENLINGRNKLFLTEMSRNVTINNIKDDFTITAATDNNVFPVPAYKTASFWLADFFVVFITLIIGILSPFGTIFIIFAVLQFFVVKRKWIYALMSAYEFLASVASVGFLLLVGLGVMLGEGLSKSFEQYGFGGFLIGMVILIVAGFYFSIKLTSRYKKIFNANQNQNIKT